ncbi:MAG TPA: cytochrome C554, partial [Gammaproteobacteria bacterium]|nr:cytochrome C554 [Gammaproteobacteria bacterium]
ERAEALVAATAEGRGATMKAFGALGSSCKSCHDSYRQKN